MPISDAILPITLIGAVLIPAASLGAGQKGCDPATVKRGGCDARVAYDDLVSMYEVDDRAAVDALLLFPPSLGSVALDAIERKRLGPDWDVRRFELAALLHTDAALRIIDKEDPEQRGAGARHLELAASLIVTGRRLRGDDALRSFASDWIVAVARDLRAQARGVAAQRFLEIARQQFPGNADAFYESGILEEHLALSSENALLERPSPGSTGPRRPSASPFSDGAIPVWRANSDRRVVIHTAVGSRTHHLGDAAGFFNTAARLDPSDEFGQLHRGRVEAERHNDNDALRILTAVLERTHDAAIGYLASMFIGGLHETRQDFASAAAAYRNAATLFPLAQSSQIALSHVLLQQRQADEARQVLAAALAGPSDQVRDPLWWYIEEPPATAGKRLASLRAAVRGQ